MTQLPPPMVDTSSSEFVVARIDTLDEQFASPLREFLEAHGIRVFVNRPAGASATYHIAVGSADFVKQIFVREETAEKRLAVIWGNGEHDVTLPMGVKVVLVDPKLPDVHDVEELFSFFFTSQAAILDSRKHSARDSGNQQEPVIVEEIKNEPAKDVLSQEDSQRIGSIIADIFDTKKEQRGESKEERRGDGIKRGRPRKARPTWVGFAIGVFLVALSPFAWFGVSLLLAVGSLGASAKLLANGDGRLVYTVRFGSYWVRQASLSWRVANAPFRLVGAWGVARHGERVVSLLGDIAQAELALYDMMQNSVRVASALLSGSSPAAGGKSPIQLVGELRLSAVSAHNHVGLAEANLTNLLDEGKFPFGIPPFSSWGKWGKGRLAKFRETSTFLEEFLALYPTIGGFSGKQTYLVLLQNSMELRPTGGFIGSIALVTVENGILDQVSVQDVYVVDGQLKGHVAPPAPIRDVLHQEHWYLRDSNWDPDFRLSGERAAWFYQKETGATVDGVIAVSLPFIVDLLKATGPLELSDYPDRITAENFFGKAIFYTQSEFFPGSTQKKDFLGAVTTTLLSKLSQEKGISVPGVFRAVSDGLDRRNLQLYFVAPPVAGLVTHFGWAGAVWGTEGCVGVAASSCVFDPILAAEANLAVNKANAFLERSARREVEFDEAGSIRQSLAFAYRNPSAGPPKDAGGAYRGYLQILLPHDAKDVRVTVDGAAVERRVNDKAALVVPFWEWSQTETLSVVGIAFDVPAGGTATVSLTYGRDTVLTFDAHGAVYEAFDQQQAGITDTASQLILRFPIFWEAIEEGQEGREERQVFLAKEAQLEYNTLIPGDRFVRVRFKK